MSKVNLNWALLSKTNLCKADLSQADLSGADLSSATLSGADLRQADLRGTGLSHASLRKADLTKASLCGADLTEACLSYSDLTETDIEAAALPGGDLRGVTVSDADLSYVDLSKANLSKANIYDVNLTGAILQGADLSEAHLSHVNLDNTDLSAANLHDARMEYSILTNIDLSSVIGLETVQHNGPSSIGIDTIYKSEGNIPQKFLREAGVPDNLIEYMGSLTAKAFEYYSCFISYSTKGRNFAERIYADLQAKGVRCWFAPHDMQSGKKLHEQIDAAIRLHERLLLILSPNSINSEWVKTEIAKARQREIREKTRILFPVRLRISFDQLRSWEYFDADIGTSSSQEIRQYYIPDFSHWKSYDSYEEEFSKLLRDLTKA